MPNVLQRSSAQGMRRRGRRGVGVERRSRGRLEVGKGGTRGPAWAEACPVASGVVAGVLGSVVLAGLFRGPLYGVTAADPAVLAAVVTRC